MNGLPKYDIRGDATGLYRTKGGCLGRQSDVEISYCPMPPILDSEGHQHSSGELPISLSFLFPSAFSPGFLLIDSFETCGFVLFCFSLVVN